MLRLAAVLLIAAPAVAQEAWTDRDLRAPIERMPALSFSVEALAGIGARMPTASPREEIIPGPDGDLRVLVFDAEPGATGRGGVLHVHGGGFVIGEPEMNAATNEALSRTCGCVIVSVDYRLAREAPFPAPLEDAYAGLTWLHGNAGALGVDPARLAVMGESAGGGLAAMLAIAARDRGEIPLAFQVLIYPMLDDRTGTTREVPAGIGETVWTRESNRRGWEAFLGRPPGGDLAPAGAVPAREDVAGLPPTWIGVGSIDLFVQENVAYAMRLIEAGVPTELLVVPGGYHGFDGVAPDSAAARAFTASWRAALTRALAAGE